MAMKHMKYFGNVFVLVGLKDGIGFCNVPAFFKNGLIKFGLVGYQVDKRLAKMNNLFSKKRQIQELTGISYCSKIINALWGP